MKRSKMVILGSARGDGKTQQALDLVLGDLSYEKVDLSQLKIQYFDYQTSQVDDDFIPLIKKLVACDDIILATPVYWYAASAQMKTFIDRFSDLLGFHRELGKKLAGKNVFLVCSYGSDYPLGCASFEVPIRMMCDYMNMNYGGCLYTREGRETLDAPLSLAEFKQRLIDPRFLDFKISGKKVSLRLATLEDRQNLYEWMYCSDASNSICRAPLFPEKAPRSWDEFRASWKAFYFQKPMSSLGHVFVIEHQGEAVGGIAYHKPDSKSRMELDVWLRSEKDCGKGLGSDAVEALCKYLYRQFGILYFWVMPSLRNPRSISAFEKNGFRRLPLTPEEGELEFGSKDYDDSVYLLKDMSVS
jgi:multimeric flavodoxin WrbA